MTRQMAVAYPDALTAAEYDAKGYCAAEFDGADITARMYDQYGRVVFELRDRELMALTAGEYDVLALTAVAFDSRGLQVREYDNWGKVLLS